MPVKILLCSCTLGGRISDLRLLFQYPSHLAAAARRQAVTAGRPLGPDEPCPLHPHGPPDEHPYPSLLTYPLMASVPEEDRSEGGRTYTVSTNSEEDQSEEESTSGDHKPQQNGFSKEVSLSPHSSRASDDLALQKKSSYATTDSYQTARGKSPSETYYTGRNSSDRSSPGHELGPVVYDHTRNSYIPRDPDCPIHSPKPGSHRTSPVRSISLRESPTRNSHFNRASPSRVTPPRTSPVRFSSSRTPPLRMMSSPSPRVSPSSPQPRSLPFKLETSRSYSEELVSPRRSPPLRSISLKASSFERTENVPKTAKMSNGGNSPRTNASGLGPVHPSRISAAESELLQCTICTQQFNNPKVLPCLHSFCERCLLSTTPAEALTISCPECKQQSILPQAGVTDLQSNTWVLGVIDSLDAPLHEGNTATTQLCCHCHLPATADAVRCLSCNTVWCPNCLPLHKKESEHEEFESVSAMASSSSSSRQQEATCSTAAAAAEASSADGPQSFHDDTNLFCPSHEGMTLRFYCRDCDTAICISCTDIEHRMHTTLRLSDAMTDQTAAMLALVDAVANKLPAVTCCIEDLTEATERLTVKRSEVEENIRAMFAKIRAAVDERETELIAALQSKLEDKQQMLDTQRQELQSWAAGMDSGRQLLQKSIQESKTPMELVLLKKQFGDRLKEHVNADLPPGPRENALLSFEPAHLDSTLSAVRRVGYVVTNPAVPYTTIASGDNLKQVTVGRRGYITVITRDFKGERVCMGGAELTAAFSSKMHGITPSPPVSPCSYASKSSNPNLQSKPSYQTLNSVESNASNTNPPSTVNTPSVPNTPSAANTPAPPEISRANSEKSSSPVPAVNGHIEHSHPSLRRRSTSDDSATAAASSDCRVKVIDQNNGVYNVEFVIYRPGKYSLDLCLYGMPIDQSPFTVSAVPLGSSCSIHGSDHSGDSPYGPVRTRQSARFSAASVRTPKSSRNTPSQRSSGSRVTLPIEDDLIMKIGIKGRSKGEFVNPQGICYSDIRGGRIVVTDSISQCVQVFSSDGEFKIRFGTRGRNVGQMQRPTGVTTLPNGNYAVADYENKVVSIFEPNGKFVHRIGQGKLLGPKGVCADRHGNIIVVDNKGSCVCIFHPNGRMVNRFGNRGTNYLQFAGPHFVAVNSQNHIVTTDFHNHCVKVFDSDGEFLFTFGSHGEGNGQFNAPTGIAVDDHDNIIVADWGNCRVQVFDSRGSFLSYINTLADPLHGPQGITYTPDGHIVVADSGNHCFKVYKYLQ
ncbi:B-box-type zinc finger [Trinorchestia longiramus]|nr:B-box-type zinc finger [Trinorchestia longiramus]